MACIADDIEKWAEDLARLIVQEIGKPIREARAEVAYSIALLRYYAQLVLTSDGQTYSASQSSEWLITRRYPLGVCALLTSWNFPMAIPLGNMAPALGYGNTVVLKPARASTVIAGTVGTIVARHLPIGTFRLISGGRETGEPLVDHPDIAAVSFTGSIKAGRLVARRAVSRGAKVQCEMGSKNPSVVLADADLDRAATTIAYAAMGYAGQKRTATSRVIIQDVVYHEFRDRLIAAVEGMRVTDPEDESCQVGPLIEEEARTSALEALERGGGRTLIGGKALGVEGFYLAPTLVEPDDPRGDLAQQEVLAPVGVLMRAHSTEEAVAMANSARRGLVATVFTNDLGKAMECTERLKAGLLQVNSAISGADLQVPFGGVEESGIGLKVQDLLARDFYTETRTIVISP